MSRFWSSRIAGLDPYVPGEQPKLAGLVKLNTNENPFGPSLRVLDAVRQAADEGLRRYPDPSASHLRQTIADHYGVRLDEVFAGNGSDEVLAFAFAALLKHEEPLLAPDITYSFYRSYCRLNDIDMVEIPLDSAFSIRPEDYRGPCGAIIIANPNAPTGIALPRAAIEAIVAAHRDQVVVVDEAYVDFGAESAVPLVRRYENLLVVQTFSKSRSLAGLRIGFAIGQRPLIEALERIKDSFNSYPLDSLAQAAGIAAIGDDAWFNACRNEIIANRTLLAEGLDRLGFQVLPSSANFVFARHSRRDGAALAAALRDQAILVRRFDKPRIADFLRITIGTAEECRRLLAVMASLV